MRLHDFRVLTFDCYGTLIDWESGLLAALQPCWRAPAFRPMPRWRLSHGTNRRSRRKPRRCPIRTCWREVHRRLAAEWGVPASRGGGCSASAPRCRTGRLFPTRRRRCTICKQHFKLVILSNVDRASFAASNRRLGVSFDAVYTAQDIGSYKPDPANFRYLLDRLAALGHRPRRDSAHRAEPVPRPRAGETLRPRHGLDRPPPRPAGLGGDHGAAGRSHLGFPLSLAGGHGGGASARRRRGGRACLHAAPALLRERFACPLFSPSTAAPAPCGAKPMTPAVEASFRAGLRAALRAGHAVLAGGGRRWTR